MKKFSILFSFLALMVVLVGCGGSESIVGVWQLHSVTGEELTSTEKSATLEFKSDGTLVQTRGDRVREGEWELKESDGKRILHTTYDGRKEEVEIETLNATDLVFIDRGEEVTLKRK